MSSDKRVGLKLAIITSSYGNGHNAAARALQDGFAAWYPDIPIVVINNREVVGPIWDSCAIAWYRFSISRGGRGYSAFCRGTEDIKSMHRYILLANAVWSRHYERLLRRRNVGFAVLTYPTTARSLDTMPQIRGYDVVVTDLSSLHPYWQCGKRCHRYMVPTQEALRDLVSFGVSPDKIDLVGYPLRLGFAHPPAREAARRMFNLSQTGKVAVYLPGSGAGIKPIVFVSTMEEFSDVVTLVVCGHDEAMRRRLSRIAKRSIILGFTDNFEACLAAADFAIGKAGPGFLAEAAAIGVPVAITGFIAPQERGNVEIAVSRGWGQFTRDVGELRAFVEATTLRRDGALQDSIDATRRIVDQVVADYREACDKQNEKMKP